MVTPSFVCYGLIVVFKFVFPCCCHYCRLLCCTIMLLMLTHPSTAPPNILVANTHCLLRCATALPILTFPPTVIGWLLLLTISCHSLWPPSPVNALHNGLVDGDNYFILLLLHWYAKQLLSLLAMLLKHLIASVVLWPLSVLASLWPWYHFGSRIFLPFLSLLPFVLGHCHCRRTASQCWTYPLSLPVVFSLSTTVAVIVTTCSITLQAGTASAAASCAASCRCFLPLLLATASCRCFLPLLCHCFLLLLLATACQWSVLPFDYCGMPMCVDT